MIAAAAFFATFSLSAQTQANPAPRPKMSHEQAQQKRQDAMARELHLTAEQKEKFEDTDRKYDERERAARSSRKEDMDNIHQERMRAHKALLTREQAIKYDQMMARKQEKHEAHAQKKGEKKPKKGKKSGQHSTTPTSTPTRGGASKN